MDQAKVLSRRARLKRALENFWRAHIVDDDPYDAFETQRLEALLREAEAAQGWSAPEDFWLAA